jgi:oligopeptide transport system substrate-binding protein
VSNGAFVLKTWNRGKSLILERNPAYHGVFKGNVQQVILRFLVNFNARLQLYEEDKLDVLGITYFPPQQREAIRQRLAEEYLSTPLLETNHLVFDTRRPPLDDARVRRALALASNRQELANVTLGGYVAPADGGFVPPGMPGHCAGMGLPYNPQQARRLLVEAGFPERQDFPALKGLSFRAAEQRSAYLSRQWQNVLGITVTWEVVEWADFLKRLKTSSAAITILGWIADYPDPDNFLRVCRARHWQGWQHKVYTNLIQQAKEAAEQSERLTFYRQAEQILAQEVPILPLVYEREHLLMKPRVKRYPMSAIRPAFWKDVVLGHRLPT